MKEKSELKNVVIFYEIEGEGHTNSITCKVLGDLRPDYICFYLQKWCGHAIYKGHLYL